MAWAVLTPEVLKVQVPLFGPVQQGSGAPGPVHINTTLPKVRLRVPMTFSGGAFLSEPGPKIAAKPVPASQLPVWNPVQHPTGAPAPVHARADGNPPKPVRSIRSIAAVIPTWSSSELTDTPAGPVPAPSSVLVPLTYRKGLEVCP